MLTRPSKAHRYLIGYVYARTHSQTGGLLQLWLVKRFGTLLGFQPLLLGLIFLSRSLWVEGGVLCGFAVLTMLFVEFYTAWKMRLPSRSSLSNITLDSLDTFRKAARPGRKEKRMIRGEGGSNSLQSSAMLGTGPGRLTRTRGSMASVLEMMSVTLAVMPSPSQNRGPVPIRAFPLSMLDHRIHRCKCFVQRLRRSMILLPPSGQHGRTQMRLLTYRHSLSRTTQRKWRAFCTLRN